MFLKEFCLNRGKKIFFDLKNFKISSGSYSGLGLSINVKKRSENLTGLSL